MTKGIKTNELCKLCDKQEATNINASLECKHQKILVGNGTPWISLMKNSRTQLDQIQTLFW